MQQQSGDSDNLLNMSDQGLQEEVTLELSPKINAQGNPDQTATIPDVQLKHQSTILSSLSEDNDQVPLPQSPQSQSPPPLQLSPKQLPPVPSVEMCQTHNKPLQIICVNDGCKICASCAIFGHHKNHSFKSQDDLVRDVNQYLSGINSVIQSKLSVEKSNVKLKLKRQTEEKALKLKDTIEKSVIGLRKLLDKIQKQANKQLDKLIKNIDQDTSKTVKKIEDDVNQQYTLWQIESSNQMQVLQLGQLQAKLSIIYSKQDQHIKKGQLILENHKSQVVKLEISQKEQLDLISVDVDSTISERLNKYISVHNKQFSLPPLPTLAQYMSNGEEKLLDQPMRFEKALDNMEWIKEESMGGSSKSDRFNNTSFSSINIPKISESFYVDKEPIIDVSFRSDNKKKDSKSSKILSETRILKPKSTKPLKVALDPKTQKALDSLLHDKLDILDLTNAELGDSVVEHITQHLPKTKCTAVKLIRNKLTDQGLIRIFPYFQNVISLNLSQNLLSDSSIDYILANLERVPKLKNLGLSMNKIKERSVREKIELIKKRGITVSI